MVVYYGSIMTVSNMEQMSSAMKMPMGWPFLALPVGGVLMAYETLRELWGLVIVRRTKRRRIGP